ncbi:hypothetical protein NBRC3293_2623 [Gluconobacter oxydans NBRC 3293]|uniref:Uncharacterized protein n=1 Tax=Gluconobacter oxydans NBRC 3293 TaxID=1315969 RepID=A0A829XCM0_GLUOY|nr:hypothetical protein NBRC3293_2623 [Gluconobacter oxydans NBRC 3293]
MEPASAGTDRAYPARNQSRPGYDRGTCWMLCDNGNGYAAPKPRRSSTKTERECFYDTPAPNAQAA